MRIDSREFEIAARQPHHQLRYRLYGAEDRVSNAHFDFPTAGNHDWGSWSGQLAAMSGELVSTIR